MCLLNLILIYLFCFIQKIIHLLKRNWPHFSLPKFCRSNIYVITIAKFSNRPIKNLFNFPQRTSMDFCISLLETRRSFIKRQTSDTSRDNEWQRVTKNSNEWYNEWQRVVQWVTTTDNEWQRVTTNGNKWLFQPIFLFFKRNLLIGTLKRIL